MGKKEASNHRGFVDILEFEMQGLKGLKPINFNLGLEGLDGEDSQEDSEDE